MYSVVMMMAMTGAPEMPALFKRRGCDGGGGCYGAACFGNGCRGYDNGCFGGRGGRRARRGGGCCGWDAGCGCYGYAACGCAGYTAGCGCVGYTAGCGCVGGMAAPVAPPTTPPPPMPPKEGQPTALIATPATIVVSLPAEATLKIDGSVTRQTSAVRHFSTPSLAAGQTFFYTLSAEIVRDGRTLSTVQTVSVRAGEETNITLPVEQFAETVVVK